MPEIPCPTCQGSGQFSYPHAAYDGHGNPIIEHVIETCDTCKGNGKVQV
jgi:DnaJ-class molecular chaperone